MSQILPFSSPEPLMANSIQPQSYLQRYSTSVESKEEGQTDTSGMGPEGQQYTLLLEFLSASHHNNIVYIFQYIPGGKQLKLLTVEIRVMLMRYISSKTNTFHSIT